jgi:hypothetical protein
MAHEAYEVWLTTDYGVRVALLSTFLELQYTIIANDTGQCSLVLPSTFDTNLLVKDYTIQVWRAPLGTSQMSLQRLYVLDYWNYAVRGGSLTIVVRASDVNCLLGRRVVAQYSGTTGAAKTDYADDMQRELVNENVVSPIDADRAMSFVTVAPERSAGPILQLRMSYKNLLSVLKQIGEASRAAGTEVFFDLHADARESAFSCEFRTKTGQPGADVTDLGVLFSEEMGSLEDAFLEYDWRKESNVVYALGQGSGVSQNIQEVEDATRSGASRFARAEGTVSAGSQQEDDEVTAVGQTALDLGRPVRRFGGRLKDTRGARYGVDWWFGSKVTARFLEQEFDAIVRSVGVRVTGDGKEEIDARAEYEG